MDKLNKIVVRCNAGMRFGFGHLSRCITLVNEFSKTVEVDFIIKTDEKELVESFFQQTALTNNYFVFFVVDKPDTAEEFTLISSRITSFSKSLLILDHYDIDSLYQKSLLQRKIRWLQLDSHGKMSFYGNWVLHASPAATYELYRPLIKSETTKLLLGVKFALIKPEVVALRENIKLRTNINQIIISFGGGTDFGATLASVRAIESSSLRNVRIRVAINKNNIDYNEIASLLNRFKDAKFIKTHCLSKEMAISDLAIIAPGMTSYEAACLGLPMLLICTADNQFINSKGWSESRCAISLGQINEITQETFINVLNRLKSSQKKLRNLSFNCFNSVDGKGASRVKEELSNTTKI